MSRKKGTEAKKCSPKPEDAGKLTQVCRDPIDKFILACAMYLGMDKGMIAHWRKEWTVMHENAMEIPSAQKCSKPCCNGIHKIKGRMIEKDGIWRPKGKKLKSGEHVTYRNQYPKYYGQFPWAMEVIKGFTGAYDEFPLSGRAINLRLDAMLKRAKLERRVTVHGLRSFAASNASQMVNGDISKLCAIMGWEENSPMAQEYVKIYNLRKTLEENKGKSLI